MIAPNRKPKPRARGSARVDRDAARALPDHFARTSILAAATQVFARQGIVTARVEDILLEAKIARRTFYKYFAGKEQVLAALHDLWTEKLLAALETALAENKHDPVAGIRAGIEIFLGFYLAGPRILRELVEIAIRSDSLLQPRRRWLRAQIARVFDEAIHALDGRRLDPLVYYGLMSALEGILLELAADESEPADAERARRVVHALFDQSLGLPCGSALPAP